MGFADWKKRSALLVDAWAGDTHLRGRIERACAAAYKAGERDGRKQAEVAAINGAALAVMVEREECAVLVESRADPAQEWGALHRAAVSIRMRSNAK